MQVCLDGKVALVTGAAAGIGRAIADTLAANKATVVYTDIDLEGAQLAASRWPGSLALPMDVSEPDQVGRAVARILEGFEHVDILVNNAGVNTLEHRVNIEQFPLEEWDRIISVDLTGLFLLRGAGAIPVPRRRTHRPYPAGSSGHAGGGRGRGLVSGRAREFLCARTHPHGRWRLDRGVPA
jgi:NAD(P)-dependent dehydrogenase (short-subunit alcohol dehydrogenase family)